MREATTYNKLVGRIGDSYYFCDDIFRYSDGLHGATATVLRPVSKDEYAERTDPDTIKDYLEECWRQSASEHNGTTLGLDAWVEEAIDIDGVDHCAGLDVSGESLWPQLRDLGLSEEDYPVIECSGGGRSFSHDQTFDEIYDSDLLAKIREAESN